MNEKEIERVIIGRPDISATLYVPWSCRRGCPFCNVAEIYKGCNLSDIESAVDKVVSTAVSVGRNVGIDAFVITGGEPSDDPRQVYNMVSMLRDAFGQKRKIYLNTHACALASLRDSTAGNMVLGVDGLSVSMPFGQDYDEAVWHAVDECSMTRKVRINAVVADDTGIDDILRFSEKVFEKTHATYLNLRSDNRKIDARTLHSSDDEVFKMLMASPDLDYMQSSGCLVCNTDTFLHRSHGTVCYHRGVWSSALTFGSTLVVNDLIVRPDGSLHYDWVDGCEVKGNIAEKLGV